MNESKIRSWEGVQLQKAARFSLQGCRSSRRSNPLLHPSEGEGLILMERGADPTRHEQLL